VNSTQFFAYFIASHTGRVRMILLTHVRMVTTLFLSIPSPMVRDCTLAYNTAPSLPWLSLDKAPNSTKQKRKECSEVSLTCWINQQAWRGTLRWGAKRGLKLFEAFSLGPCDRGITRAVPPRFWVLVLDWSGRLYPHVRVSATLFDCKQCLFY
jgi:hypothetical protein